MGYAMSAMGSGLLRLKVRFFDSDRLCWSCYCDLGYAKPFDVAVGQSCSSLLTELFVGSSRGLSGPE